MLIIARHKGQKIVIGDGIEIVVTDLSRTTVKLGILAPTPYTILRGEVKESIERANREALGSQLGPEDEPTERGAAGVELAEVGSFGAGGVRNLPPSPVNSETERGGPPPSTAPNPENAPEIEGGGE